MTIGYTVAKYIPCIERNEPRNIGVIVWAAHGLAARFLGERPGRPGTVLPRDVPPFVHDVAGYQDWIRHWRHEMSQPTLAPRYTGPLVPRSSPEFLRLLVSSHAGPGYLLRGDCWWFDRYDGPDDLQHRADELFSKLVLGGYDPEGERGLDQACAVLVDASGLAKERRWHQHFAIGRAGGPAGDDERFEFSYAYVGDQELRLYHKVPLWSRVSDLRRSVREAAWMFSRMHSLNYRLAPAQGAALVLPTEDQRASDEVGGLLRALGKVVRVFDLEHSEPLLAEWRALPAAVAFNERTVE